MDEIKQTPNAASATPPPETSPTPTEPAPTPPLNQPLQPGQPVTVPGKPKNKNMMLAIVVVAILAVAGVAYGVYAYVTNTPDYLLNRATEQFTAKNNTTMAARFKVTSGNGDANMTFTGDVAARSDENSKNGEVVLGVGTGDSRVTLSARLIDDTTYLKLGSLTNLGNLAKTFAPDTAELYNSDEMKAALARVDNKWFSITKEDVQSLTGEAGSEATTTTSGPTAEEMQKVVEIYRKHKVLQPDKTFADEVVDGTNTAHFTVKVNKTELTNFLNEVKAANLQSFKLTDQDVTDAQKAVDEMNGKATFDVWIARDSQKFKQVGFTSTEKGSEGSLTLTLVNDLPQFEKLEKPADARPFSELLTTFLGPTTTDFDESMLLYEEELQ